MILIACFVRQPATVKARVKTARTVCYEILRELREAKQFNPANFASWPRKWWSTCSRRRVSTPSDARRFHRFSPSWRMCFIRSSTILFLIKHFDLNTEQWKNMTQFSPVERKSVHQNRKVLKIRLDKEPDRYQIILSKPQQTSR